MVSSPDSNNYNYDYISLIFIYVYTHNFNKNVFKYTGEYLNSQVIWPIWTNKGTC